jgi:iron complex outermembrane recepter protein
LTGGDFEQIELIKGHTPDQSANSLGGSVNLKTASPLNMPDKRRFSYSVFAKWAPSFLEQWSGRLEHPMHPIVNLSYQEAFDVAGGKRNLGVSVSLFYIEQAFPRNDNFYGYNNAPTGPAFLHDFRDASSYVNKHVFTPSVRLEYRPTGVSRFQIGLLYNKEDTADNSFSEFRAFTSQTVAGIGPDGRPTGTGTILPGFSETKTQVRGLPASIAQITSNVLSFYAKTPSVNFAGEHKLGRWELDYKLGRSDSHVDAGHGNSGPKGDKGEGGGLLLQARNIGWIVDRSNRASPTFTQTEGPSIYDVGTYSALIQHTSRDLIQDNQIRTAELNTALRLPEQLRTVLKGGLLVEQRIQSLATRNSRQFNRVSGAPSLPNSRIFEESRFDQRHGGRLPMVDPRATKLELSNPTLWTEDLYFGESQRLSGTRKGAEKVRAAYAMFRSSIGRLDVLGGTRLEDTTFIGQGFVKRSSATAAQIPDPVLRAQHDWDNAVRTEGSYSRSFPSIHLAYDLTANIKARASWSTSFGRPALTVLMPTATANENARTVTTSNPALGPQYAKNVDATVEYYFRPAGFLKMGFFRKNIKDFILTTRVGTVAAGTDNGFGGDYAGFELLSQANAGRADVEGWELDYRQQLLFLPGLLKGFELGGNFTYIETHGNFGGATDRTGSEVPGFVPRTFNVSLGYTYKRIGTRINYSYLGDYLQTFNELPGLRTFWDKQNLVSASVFYALKPNLTISVDMTNVLADRRESYQYIPGRTMQIFTPSQTISIGVRGRF